MTSKNKPSLLDTFKSLPEPQKQILANIDSPLLLGLMTLLIVEENELRDYMSAEHIVAALEAAGVAVKRNQILRAFSRAGTRISRKIIDEEIHYKIMTQGRNEVLPLLGEGDLQVFCIEAGKPRTARKVLGDIFSVIKGEVRICDPYYGTRSLDTLDKINKNCKIRFLTGKTNENHRKLTGHISDFKRERPNFEIRLYPKSNEIHDRFILCSDYLLILGHGVKDIGNKESFIIKIDASYANDLIKNIENAFDTRWQISQVI